LYSINRNVAVIKPKRPFWHWLKSLPDDNQGFEITEDELRRDCLTFLVPEAYSTEDARKYLEKHYKEIFKIELVSWHRKMTDWPKRRTLKLFRDWFEIEFHSEVIDLGQGRITKEEFDWREEIL
jgi:hypothetical protein